MTTHAISAYFSSYISSSGKTTSKSQITVRVLPRTRLLLLIHYSFFRIYFVKADIASGAKKSSVKRTVGDFLITPALFAEKPDYQDSYYALI